MTVPVEIAAWLGCLVFCVALYNQLSKAKANLFGEKKTTEVSPQPLVVKAVGEFAQERDCVGRYNQVEGQIAELRTKREEDLRAGSGSRRAIYEEIAKTTEQTRRHMESVRTELSEKIDNMPDRMIAILRNTGALK